MADKSLSRFVELLEEKGELVRVKTEVSPELEVTEIADRCVKHGEKALLIENNGTDFPILINAFASDERLSLILNNRTPDEIGNEIELLLGMISQKGTGIISKLKMLPKLKQVASWMPGKFKGSPPCQEVVHENPDLNMLPVLKCWPFDGGRFVTLPIVHTIDPETEERNVGMYRMQIFDKDLTGMHWHLHKDSASHYRKYKAMKKRMPVAVALGGDLIYTYAATAPLPENIDEYLFAGFLRNKKVKLAKCISQPIEVPADADIVIEGYVDPEEELILEGPFGDHTGFYSLADYYPKFHVTCITHRKNAIYPATIVGIPPVEDAWLGKATEQIFLSPIKLTVSPEIVDLHMPAVGVFHNLVLVKIKNAYPGQAFKVMNALWGAGQMMFSKILVVFDEDVDIHNYHEVAQAFADNVDLNFDIQINRGPADVLDHASRKFAFHSKMGFDATRKSNAEKARRRFGLEKIEFLDLFENHNLVDNFGLCVASLKDDKDKGEIYEAIQKTELRMKYLLLVDNNANVQDLHQVAWLVLNNIDPSFDCEAVKTSDGAKTLVVDGTSKNNKPEFQKRRWPNVITSDDKTIAKIDAIWKDLGIGEFIKSPSLLYKTLVNNEGAEKN